MKIIRDYQFVNTSDRGASVAVGNFDGVHLGHQYVIEIARVWGKKNKSPLGVLTFEPHPRSYFAPESPSFRLMNSDAKSTRLNKLNVENNIRIISNKYFLFFNIMVIFLIYQKQFLLVCTCLN